MHRFIYTYMVREPCSGVATHCEEMWSPSVLFQAQLIVGVRQDPMAGFATCRKTQKQHQHGLVPQRFPIPSLNCHFRSLPPVAPCISPLVKKVLGAVPKAFPPPPSVPHHAQANAQASLLIPVEAAVATAQKSNAKAPLGLCRSHSLEGGKDGGSSTFQTPVVEALP